MLMGLWLGLLGLGHWGCIGVRANPNLRVCLGAVGILGIRVNEVGVVGIRVTGVGVPQGKVRVMEIRMKSTHASVVVVGVRVSKDQVEGCWDEVGNGVGVPEGRIGCCWG